MPLFRHRRLKLHQRVQAVMDLTPDAIVLMRADGVIVAWNDGAEAIFGLDAAAAVGSTIWSMMPEGYDDLYAGYFRGIADGTIAPPRHPVEIVAMKREGATFAAELSVGSWTENRDAFVMCIFRDLTEHRTLESELRASTEHLESVLDGVSESSIIATDLDGIVTVFNRGGEQLLGYAASEVCGSMNLLQLHDPAEIEARAAELGADRGVDALFAAARGGETQSRDWTYLTKNGDRIPVSLTISPKKSDGELRGFIAVARDLTAQRRAERRIELGTEAFRTVFDSAPVAVVLTKPDLTCAHASSTFCELTGYTVEQLRNMSMLELIVPDDDCPEDEVLDRESSNFASILDGRAQVHHSERRVRRADGSAVWVREHTSLVTDQNGDLLLFVSHLEDITQEQRLQHAMSDALDQKMKTLDRLEELDRAKSDFVSMVSHELRSPVTSIIGYLELLGDGSYGELAAAQSEALGVVARNAARLEHLIADLMTLSKLETGSHARLEMMPVQMAAVIADVTTSMRPILGGRRQPFTLDVDPSVGTVLGDVRQLEHVVTNLLTNASKFTPEGGPISVDARRMGDEVVIAVRDTGIGIDAEDLAKVFARFYRGSGQDVAQVPGTGLGLAIVRGIVTQHGGDVSIESERGVGTTVTVVLPAAETAPEELPKPVALDRSTKP